jgi:hypothetical protein
MKKLISFVLLITLSGCSTYRSTWECPKLHGIGCSSLEYADMVAKEQILLNSTNSNIKNLLINENVEQ